MPSLRHMGEWAGEIRRGKALGLIVAGATITDADGNPMLLDSTYDFIYATGGASKDLPVLQVMADVFNCPVRRIEVTKSAALGAALRAAHGWLVHTGQKPAWKEIVAGFTAPIQSASNGSVQSDHHASIPWENSPRFAWRQ